MLLVVIIMICNDSWGFSIDPPYFGYNSAEQENHVLCIFTFQEPSHTQIDLKFVERQYFINEGGHDGQTRPGGAGPGLGHATQVCLDLGPLLSPIFVS
jgi:hypothetical protein